MPSHQDHPDRLAAAARALAAAASRSSGVADTAKPSRRRAPRTRPLPSQGTSQGTSQGMSHGAPPPEDPAATGPEPDQYDVARAIVLRQLSNAPKSRAQLEQALRRRSCPEHVAEAVLDRMEEVGLVDDEAYAQLLIRSKQAGRGLARRALAHELRTKGVDDDTARAALEEVTTEHERERARELVAKKLRSMHGLEAHIQTRRLAGMLARKGYDAEVSMSVIRQAVAEAPEHQRD